MATKATKATKSNGEFFAVFAFPLDGLPMIPQIPPILLMPMRVGSAEAAINGQGAGLSPTNPYDPMFSGYHRMDGAGETFVRTFVSILRERRLEKG
jgi:hypothetical protein